MSETLKSRPDIALVHKTFPHVKYMKLAEAEFIRDLVTKHELDNLLELGTYRGKGTAYMAVIQEARGRGHVTTLDLVGCLRYWPNVQEILLTLGVSHRATIRLTERSFTHTLMKMLEEKPRPVFDFAYIDGAHTWDGTGFSFVLVDLMLRPGGWIIFDDLNWTIQEAVDQRQKRRGPPKIPLYADYSDEEKRTQLVRKVWELLVPEAGYVNMSERGKWGIAQKSAA